MQLSIRCGYTRVTRQALVDKFSLSYASFTNRSAARLLLFRHPVSVPVYYVVDPILYLTFSFPSSACRGLRYTPIA